MYITGFGRGWRPAGHRAKRYADKHGWNKTGYNSCGDPIMYARGHIFEYLSYTYDAGHTHESCIVKRRIRRNGWQPSRLSVGSFSFVWLIIVGIIILVIVALVFSR